MRLTTDPRLVPNVNAILVGHAQLRDTRRPQLPHA
jgi:hypothetical protein